MFHRLFHYFFYQRQELRRRPRQYINEYDIRLASHDEQLLMKAVKARSPEEASRLMKKYKAANVYELLAKLQDEKPSILKRIQSRAIALWMKIEGASPRHPIDNKRYFAENRLENPYAWKNDSNDF